MRWRNAAVTIPLEKTAGCGQTRRREEIDLGEDACDLGYSDVRKREKTDTSSIAKLW